MNSNAINFDTLFDAEEYVRSGSYPWTFFAYPTSLALDHGLPPDNEVCRMLACIQARGIAVAIWNPEFSMDTTYFACRKEDRQRLHEVLAELEQSNSWGVDFCARRTEALFARLENRD